MRPNNNAAFLLDLFFSDAKDLVSDATGSPQMGKGNWRFATNMWPHLGHRTRSGHSYSGPLIGSDIWLVE